MCGRALEGKRRKLRHHHPRGHVERRVFLHLALVHEEIVIAAATSARMIAADRRAVLVHRAATGLAVEEATHRIEEMIRLVAEHALPRLVTLLREARACLGRLDAEAAREPRDVGVV